MSLFFATRKPSCGNVMFLHVFVCQRGWCIHPPMQWCRGIASISQCNGFGVHQSGLYPRGCIQRSTSRRVHPGGASRGGVHLSGLQMDALPSPLEVCTPPPPPPEGCAGRQTVNKRAVRILLECILVKFCIFT